MEIIYLTEVRKKGYTSWRDGWRVGIEKSKNCADFIFSLFSRDTVAVRNVRLLSVSLVQRSRYEPFFNLCNLHLGLYDFLLMGITHKTSMRCGFRHLEHFRWFSFSLIIREQDILLVWVPFHQMTLSAEITTNSQTHLFLMLKIKC